MPDAADEGGSGERPHDAAEREAFAARIAELEQRLGRMKSDRQARAHTERDARTRGQGMAYGLRMSAELVASVLVGGLIGWGLDRWLGSSPWLFLLFFMLGFAAGVLNVLRAYERMRKEGGF
jgi:ATP synthase protein I